MTPRGAKRHAAPTRRSEIQTLRQVARELFAPLSLPGKETPTHEGARAFFRRFPFFWGGGSYGFDFLSSAPAREQGFRAPFRVWVCRRSEPEARLCGRAEGSVLLVSGRAGARPGRGRARLGRMPFASPPADPRSLRRLGSWLFWEKSARSVDIKEHNKMTTLKSARCHVAPARRKAIPAFRGGALFF